MSDLSGPTSFLIVVFGLLACLFVLAAIGSLVGKLRQGAATKSKATVAVDVDQSPTIFHLNDGSTVRSDMPEVVLKDVDPERRVTNEPAGWRSRKHAWICVAAVAAALLVYWLGHPWTRGQCLMEASKRHTVGGVMTARDACAEMFPER